MSDRMTDRDLIAQILHEGWRPGQPIEGRAMEICLNDADAILAALSAQGRGIVGREPSRSAASHGSAMFWDTCMAPGHPEREENGGKYSKLELTAIECWRAMFDTSQKENGNPSIDASRSIAKRD